MRIERLAIEGFGPYAERQEVDFAELDAAGVFLITGRTGSGKSSVLDAICFALYGSAPRYDGGQARLRSDHAAPDAPTEVELVFTVRGDRWRILRSPAYDRPKKRGEGTTPQKEAATLERWTVDGWSGVAARPTDVADHLAPVLQLSREQFLQVVLLAQGRFQEFLKARSEDRLGLLRALFGTERFQRFEAEIGDRAKALEEAVGARAAGIDADLGRLGELTGEEPGDAAWAEGAASRLDASADAADATAIAAQGLFVEADRAEAEAVRVAALQVRRRRAREALVRLDGARVEIEQVRARVVRAVGVLPLLPVVAAADRGRSAMLQASRAVEGAIAALGGDVRDPVAEGEALDALAGRLAAPLADERAMPTLVRSVEEAERTATAAAAGTASLVQQAEALPAERAALAADRARFDAFAAGRDEAETALLAARARQAAVAEADRAAQVLRHAQEQHDDALARQQTAIQRARDLLRARLDGAAGLLAASLRPGDPCPVCGGVEHPSPAEGDSATPDDAAVAAAETAQQEASARSQEAGRIAAAARAVAAQALAASGGTDAETARRAVDDAERKALVARDASADRDRIDLLIARLETRAAELDERSRGARAAESAAVTAAALARTRHAEAAARVRDGRGDAASVAERIGSVADRRARLRSLEQARQGEREAAEQLRGAEDRLASSLEQAGLPDEDAVRADALPAPEREALERRVREWDSARSSAEAQLSDADVAAAPEQPVDTVAAAAAKAAALEQRDDAAGRRAASRLSATSARALAERIRAADRAVAADRAALRVVASLADTVRGGGVNERRMRLESYVLAARLEQIVAAANSRLATMTDGRFTLQHDDSIGYRNVRSGLGLEVLDAHTGRPRPIASLSGGETFLASLSLALGLAEVVSEEAGGVRLDTLFVDEGFGSLDRETLDTAMATLDSLRAGGRTVGLISHVETMQEEIPAGLHVDRLPDGSSTIRVRALV